MLRIARVSDMTASLLSAPCVSHGGKLFSGGLRVELGDMFDKAKPQAKQSVTMGLSGWTIVALDFFCSCRSKYLCP